jgi:hypothetical protein
VPRAPPDARNSPHSIAAGNGCDRLLTPIFTLSCRLSSSRIKRIPGGAQNGNPYFPYSVSLSGRFMLTAMLLIAVTWITPSFPRFV